MVELKGIVEETISLFFIKREDGMLVISSYYWIVYQKKFKMNNNYTEMFRRNKNINTGVAKLIKDNTTF